MHLLTNSSLICYVYLIIANYYQPALMWSQSFAAGHFFAVSSLFVSLSSRRLSSSGTGSFHCFWKALWVEMLWAMSCPWRLTSAAASARILLAAIRKRSVVFLSPSSVRVTPRTLHNRLRCCSTALTQPCTHSFVVRPGLQL